jgi:acyl-CoA synthetase (AMP-forming)/AMP-acid ligase II
MREHGVTHASATPTFWRLLANLVDPATAAELPLRQITLGGEAVPDRLLAELGALFPDATISQIYGATEFGTSVSVRDGENGLPASVLERTDDSPTQLKIVDGQLWVRSSIGMLGYYGEEAAPEDGWRATGDLVELRGDRIHFVGRAAETINVGGVKVHPLPVETAVGAIDEVELVRAFGRKNSLTGQVVAVEVVARAGADLEALEVAIHQACAGLPAAARPRQIKFVDELNVRDQKIVRHPEQVTEPPTG